MKTALSDSIEFIGAIQINLSIYLSIYTDGQLNMVRYGIRQKAQRVYTVCRQLPCFTLTNDERFYHVFKRFDFSTCSTFLTFFLYFISGVYFYRAMLCIRGTSHGPVSVVCLSVTSRCSIETAERIELVFAL